MEQGRLTFNDSVSDVSNFAASPLSDYLIFEDRLNKITRDVLQTKMTPAWVRYMAARTEDEWIYAIRAATPPAVKNALDNKDPPSIEDLKSLPWVITFHFGVYGRAIWSKDAKDCHIYVGSATGRYDLEGRKMRHGHINTARGCRHTVRFSKGTFLPPLLSCRYVT